MSETFPHFGKLVSMKNREENVHANIIIMAKYVSGHYDPSADMHCVWHNCIKIYYINYFETELFAVFSSDSNWVEKRRSWLAFDNNNNNNYYYYFIKTFFFQIDYQVFTQM